MLKPAEGVFNTTRISRSVAWVPSSKWTFEMKMRNLKLKFTRFLIKYDVYLAKIQEFTCKTMFSDINWRKPNLFSKNMLWFMSTGLEPKICVTKMQSFLKRLNSREILALNLLIHSKRELNISYWFPFGTISEGIIPIPICKCFGPISAEGLLGP